MYKKYIYIIYSRCKTSVLKVVFEEKKSGAFLLAHV